MMGQGKHCFVLERFFGNLALGKNPSKGVKEANIGHDGFKSSDTAGYRFR